MIFGSTGLVGSHLTQDLQNRDEFSELRTLVRNLSQAPRSPKIRPFPIDLDRPELSESAFLGVTDAFVSLGTTIKKAGSRETFQKIDCEAPLQFLRRLKGSGLKRVFAVTALGADPDSKIFYNHVKGQFEAGLKALDLETVHIFRPSLLIGERQESRPGERFAQNIHPLTDLLCVGPFKKFHSTPAGNVARAMVQAAVSPKPGFFIHEPEGGLFQIA